jgi:hypothetical protein
VDRDFWESAVNGKDQPGFDAALAVIFIVCLGAFGLLVVTFILGSIFRAGKGFGLW